MQKFQDTVLSRDGSPVNGATITVTTSTGSAATIYSDNGSTVITSLTTGRDGSFAFYAADGRYNISISGDGITTKNVTDILLEDPAQGTTGLTTQTLSVPSTYATIQAALDFLAVNTIAAGATVTIQVAAGTYNLTAGMTINHPQGSQIRLVGAGSGTCILSVAGSGFDCLAVTDGHTLGYLNGFKFYKTVKALAADNTTGVLAQNNGTIICGPDIVTDNWYYGIAARQGSVIFCDSAQVDHAGDVGIWSFVGSTVRCRNAISNNASDVANGLGFGIQAEYGSAVDCQSASATGCRIGGIAALSNSLVRALAATSSTNTGSGFYAIGGGVIEAEGSTASNNTRYGCERVGSGEIRGTLTLSGNVIAANSGYAYLDNSGTLGARVAFSGDGRIDNVGTGDLFYNTTGGPQFGVQHAASAVNYLKVTGSATGVAPRLFAFSSTDTNVVPRIVGQGTGGPAFSSQNGQILTTNDPGTGTQVNYVAVFSGAAGAGPRIQSAGSDTNVDLRLISQGTGIVTSPATIRAQNGTAIPAGGTAGAGFTLSSTTNFGVFFGSGAPTLSAAKGSLYLRSDGSSTSTRMYVNTDGATAWTNVTTAT